jgi:acyl transferase domain-containing protein/NAD(P)-dependent dehydrogenase (short-subunit alcohol dehydrogenase family)/acyl carrier protein
MQSTTSSFREPIAIVGMGCRFPGNASNPQDFWKSLCKGFDAIIDIPKGRWDSRRFYHPHLNAPGKMYVSKGGFLQEKWEDFDAEFFHISPREAVFLDPQQRLLLELVWEALEDGGIVPSSIRGTDTGVYIGAFTTDWQSLHNNPHNLKHCSMYSGMNGSMTILSARLSHFFDFKGPCLTVDTACSSSLVAVHLACQSLWQNTCKIAMAGGVNAILTPQTTIALSKGRFLNPEGYCRPFDAEAKGYVRGEGGGVVILKRLSDALRDQDDIYAVLRGTGINHDGHTPGIAQPDAQSQQTLITKVLEESGVDPCQISYVEAHGTGTAVGDPIEAQALNSVLNKPERKSLCLVGAVKSNMGHLEAAAGIAGLIKTVLCLKNLQVPPNLHFKNHNPAIPFKDYCLKVPTAMQDLISDQPCFAGVNAFGYGGTNAHAILQSFSKQKQPEPAAEISGSYLLPFSSRSQEGLKELAKKHARYLQENPLKLEDIAYTLSKKRALFDHRMTVHAHSNQDLITKLHTLADGVCPEGCIQGKTLATPQRLVFIYTGMGPQNWGMGKQLSEIFPVFRETLTTCDRILLPITGWSLLEELFGHDEGKPIEDPVIAQLANFALQAALTDLFRSLGIRPDAVIGHSIGEVAAAYAAEALTLQDGLLVAYQRSRIQSSKQNQGAMLAAGLTLEEAEACIQASNKTISIAAINSPRSLTLSGNREDLESLAAILDRKNVFHRFLKVNIAYHSHQMDPLENEVLTSLKCIKPQKCARPFISTVHADYAPERLLDAEYWWKNIRQPVNFKEALQGLIKEGDRLFVEIGPQPVLSAAIKENLAGCTVEGVAIPSLNRKKKEDVSFHECLGALFVHGYPLCWDLLHPAKGNFVRLPTYAWQKKPFWIESEESREYRLSAPQHVMLSRRVKVPHPAWQVEINEQFFPWLPDHKVGGSIVFPAAAYVEAGLAICGEFPCLLENVNFLQILAINSESDSILQISLHKDTKAYTVHSLSASDESDWICHASGKCSAYHSKTSPPSIDIDLWREKPSIDEQAVYSRFSKQELDYGPAFRGIKKLWKQGKEAFSEIHLQANQEGYHLHPALLDAVLQTLIGTIDPENDQEGLILPSRIERLIFYCSPQKLAFCHAQCIKTSKEMITGNLRLYDEKGMLCLEINGLECRVLNQSSEATPQLLYRPIWEEKPLENLHSTLAASEKCLLITPNIDGLLRKSMENQHIDSDTVSFSDFTSLESAEQIISSKQSIKNLTIVFDCQAECSDKALANLAIDNGVAFLHLVQAIERIRIHQSTTVWVLTRGMHAVDGRESWLNPCASTVLGICRVITQECSSIICRVIDLDPSDSDPFDYSLLFEEMSRNIGDNEIAWRQQKRYVYKLKSLQNDKSETDKTILLSSPKEAFALHLNVAGRIENLSFRQIEKPLPKRGEVGIEVHSTSLNFKDLLKILGMLDKKALENTYFGEKFGMECSGTVVSVGPHVKGYSIGDTVCAFAPDTFQSYLTLHERYLCPIPPTTTLEQAPVYVPFITALRALRDLAKLKKNETILIHSATGAVGQAAIQYAKHVGARIIATASNEEKHKYLLSLGVDVCAPSRSLSFAEDVLKWTNGKGVDVILNSLAGDFLTKSFSLLASYGRFIEIGKRDITMNNSLPMQYFNNNTAFMAIDLDRTFVDQPGIIKRLLKDVYQYFKKGIFTSLPCQVFPAREAIEAFQYMARAKHTGKIMLKFANEQVEGLPLDSAKAIVHADASYLVTGGLNGFGLSVAQWLAKQGARHLILLGRTGAASLEAQDVVQALKDKGINVKVASMDVTEIESLSNVLKTCEKTMPPLKGIIHSAMVLKDAFLQQQTQESFQEVLAPKIKGCWNLHKLSLEKSLDFFVLFSSISSIIGNPGQTNYSAANAFLDTFCHYRKRLGLPALTINWGALQTGVFTRNDKMAKHLESHGIQALRTKTALEILELALQNKETQLCAFAVNWEKLLNAMPPLRHSSAFADFATSISQASSSIFLDSLNQLDEAARQHIVIEKIKELVVQSLKVNPVQLDAHIRLTELGVDSLMAMELEAVIEKQIGMKIPTIELMKGPTIAQLAQYLCRSMPK